MPGLSRREGQALTLLAQGYSNRSIAKLLDITTPTVAMHLQNARRRLNARTREQAVAIAMGQGLIDLSAPIPSADAYEVAGVISGNQRIVGA